MAHTEMARFYNIPSGGYIGLTNSHCNDAQSGYETGMNTMLALMGGADLFNMGGLLGSLMAFDFGKAYTDNEIAMMLKRACRGMEFSEENLCLDLIHEIGPGGSYMDKLHTVKHMRKTMYLSKLAYRLLRDQWIRDGATDTQTRALEKAIEILKQENPARFPEELDAKIRSHFPGLVPGDAIF